MENTPLLKDLSNSLRRRRPGPHFSILGFFRPRDAGELPPRGSLEIRVSGVFPWNIHRVRSCHNMKLLAHIRSKSRLKSTDNTKPDEKHFLRRTASDIWTAPNPTATFSSPLLEELLSYVCPHSRDDTYTSCEESMVDGGCMLCDMRDLSQCALVNQQWFKAAQNLL